MAKILIVAHPRSVHTRARGIVGMEAGHQIFWVSTPPSNLPGVKAFGPSAFKGRWSRLFLEPWYLLKAAHQVKPDIYHVHYARQGLRTPILLTCRPMIVTIMGGDVLPDQGYRGIHRPLVQAMLNHADIITSKSAFLDDALAKIGDYHAKIRRVTWGIDLERFRPDLKTSDLRAQWHIPASDLIFFDPRLAQPLYNKHIILAAFARYLETGGPSATLLIATGASALPDYVAQLHQQANDAGIVDRVRFVGAVDYAHMPAYYAVADVTISVPRSDGLPQTIYEALACGSFLIIGNLPQYAGTVIEGVTARCVPVGAVDPLAEAMTWIATHPDIRVKVGEIGRDYVQKHADHRFQKRQVNKLYEGLLSRHDQKYGHL